MNDLNELYGETITSYSRADAISDGVLFDVSDMAKDAGFKFPVAVTSSVHSLLDYNKNGQSFEGRVWDMLSVLRYTIKSSKGGSQINFTVKLIGGSPKKNHEFKAVIGPGDTVEPVITIMLPNED